MCRRATVPGWLSGLEPLPVNVEVAVADPSSSAFPDPVVLEAGDRPSRLTASTGAILATSERRAFELVALRTSELSDANAELAHANRELADANRPSAAAGRNKDEFLASAPQELAGLPAGTVHVDGAGCSAHRPPPGVDGRGHRRGDNEAAVSSPARDDRPLIGWCGPPPRCRRRWP